MKEYEVTIVETLRKSIKVDATTREEAIAAVVELWNKGEIELNSDHFVGADFDCDMGQELEGSKQIDVLLVEPGEYARMATINADLSSMREIVGGDIQEACFFDDPVSVVCNEEGEINKLPMNRAIRDSEGRVIDVVAGTFFICGAEGESFSSLPKNLRKKYEERFKNPEVFLQMGQSILAVPTEPSVINGRAERKAPVVEL